MPIESIAQALKPTDAQRVALDSLNDATTKAAGLLKANCPKEQVLTPPGRVAMMEQRLNAMLEAIKIVEPELDAFYGLLTMSRRRDLISWAPAKAEIRGTDLLIRVSSREFGA